MSGVEEDKKPADQGGAHINLKVKGQNMADQEFFTARAIDAMEQLLAVQTAILAGQNRSRVGTMADFRQLAPPVFTGTEGPLAADQWMRKTVHFLDMAGVPEGTRVGMEHVQLEGSAYSWWDVAAKQFPQGATWEQFQEMFLARYFPESAQDEMERQFTVLQQGQMSVVEYETEFCKLSQFAPHLVMTDAARRKKFVRGLSVYLQQFMVGHRYVTYAQSVALATGYELHKVPSAVEQQGGLKRHLDTSVRSAGPMVAKRPLYVHQQQVVPFQQSLQQYFVPVEPQYQGQRHAVTCYHCGKFGHIQRGCPMHT